MKVFRRLILLFSSKVTFVPPAPPSANFVVDNTGKFAYDNAGNQFITYKQ